MRLRPGDRVGKIIAGNRIIFGQIMRAPQGGYAHRLWEGIPGPRSWRGQYLDAIPASYRQHLIDNKLYHVGFNSQQINSQHL